MVDFQEKNEQFIDHGAHFLFENRSLVDFQEKNEQCIDHGAHFLFENRALVDFQEKNGPMGAILMKMAVFLNENVSSVDDFLKDLAKGKEIDH